MVGWDDIFMNLAMVVAMKSKDPRTKVGALIERDRRVLSLGFNGIPTGVKDLPERLEPPDKYDWMLHAEFNAAANAHCDLRGATLYCTIPCCTPCTLQLIQFGIKEIVIAEEGLVYLKERHWEEGEWYHRSKRLVAAYAMSEANIVFRTLPGPI